MNSNVVGDNPIFVSKHFCGLKIYNNNAEKIVQIVTIFQTERCANIQTCVLSTQFVMEAAHVEEDVQLVNA